MKTIVEINSTNYASTGNIMLNIAKQARLSGYNVYTCCKASKESYKYKYDNQIIIGYRYERILSAILNTITGLRDYGNIFGTYFFVNKLKKIKPDLVHLHVLHDDFINTRILFNYLAKANIPVIWTFHDVVPLTGKCPGFDIINCEKWKTGCYKCPQLKLKPKSLFFDTTSHIWHKRKKEFTSVKNMVTVSPSIWLKDAVKESFFKKYPCEVINNGINLSIFKPIENTIKKDYKIGNKYLILGVANVWNERKGLDIFVELSKRLSDDYQIVLVGTNNDVDKLLPDNIISIHRTYNQEELVKLYSAADLFINPTKDENFPTVNIESLACGTPVITFKTGGSPEIIDETCGLVVEKNDIDTLEKQIINVCTNKSFTSKDCLNRAQQFNMENKFKEYVDLYNQLLK